MLVQAVVKVESPRYESLGSAITPSPSHYGTHRRHYSCSKTCVFKNGRLKSDTSPRSEPDFQVINYRPDKVSIHIIHSRGPTGDEIQSQFQTSWLEILMGGATSLVAGFLADSFKGESTTYWNPLRVRPVSTVFNSLFDGVEGHIIGKLYVAFRCKH